MMIQSSSTKEAIAVIGGGLVKDAKTGRWRTTNFDEGDNFGVQGDRLRVVAAALLAKEKPQTLFIALGGKGQLKDIPDAPAVAEALKRELLELGVPAKTIVEEKESGNAYQQLQQLQNLIQEYSVEQAVVISNRFHLPRLQAMIEYGPKLDNLKELLHTKRLTLSSAEEILLEREPEKWQEMIGAAYQSKAMQERMALEEKGVEQIKAGTYQFR